MKKIATEFTENTERRNSFLASALSVPSVANNLPRLFL
jgi:hypothetical protein